VDAKLLKDATAAGHHTAEEAIGKLEAKKHEIMAKVVSAMQEKVNEIRAENARDRDEYEKFCRERLNAITQRREALQQTTRTAIERLNGDLEHLRCLKGVLTADIAAIQASLFDESQALTSLELAAMQSLKSDVDKDFEIIEERLKSFVTESNPVLGGLLRELGE
jgi:dynactin complex subunit